MAIVQASYLTFALVVYKWCGKWVTNPSLGSAGPTMKKVAYGIGMCLLFPLFFLLCSEETTRRWKLIVYPRSHWPRRLRLPVPPRRRKIRLRAPAPQQPSSAEELAHPLGYLALLHHFSGIYSLHPRRSNPNLQLSYCADRVHLFRAASDLSARVAVAARPCGLEEREYGEEGGVGWTLGVDCGGNFHVCGRDLWSCGEY